MMIPFDVFREIDVFNVDLDSENFSSGEFDVSVEWRSNLKPNLPKW